jgi:hypothetical protein
MDRTLTPLEAWDDFVSVVVPTLPKPIPLEIQHARYARHRRGTFDALGSKRIKRLLEKYAPDRYTFQEAVIVHDLPDQP